MLSAQNVRIVSDNWTVESILPPVARMIQERFLLRKNNIERAKVIGRRICWILKACGMFMLRAKKARDHIARKTLLRYFIVHLKPKMARMRKKRAKIIHDFLLRNTNYPNDPNQAFLRYARKIEKIKRNFKIYSRHERLKLCIMNFQWSEYEKEEIRNHKMKSLVGVGGAKGASRIPETGVPVRIRLFYMKGYRKYQRKLYAKALAKWEKECEVIKAIHIKDLSKRNAGLALAGEELIREEPNYGPKPFIHVFIPKHKLREIVRESLYKSKSWKMITMGATKFVDLPILKSITS